MAKKLSTLKPQRLRHLKFFLSFSYYTFEDTVTYFDKNMLKKKLSKVQNFIVE